MKIHYNEIKRIEANIDDDQVLRIVNEDILNKFKLDGCHIDDNDDLIQVEWVGGGSHTWDERTELREATDLDKAVFLVLKELSVLHQPGK